MAAGEAEEGEDGWAGSGKPSKVAMKRYCRGVSTRPSLLSRMATIRSIKPRQAQQTIRSGRGQTDSSRPPSAPPHWRQRRTGRGAAGRGRRFHWAQGSPPSRERRSILAHAQRHLLGGRRRCDSAGQQRHRPLLPPPPPRLHGDDRSLSRPRAAEDTGWAWAWAWVGLRAWAGCRSAATA
eukprot:scaffold2914_cov156-Ochromonas_danica.AAC.21